MSATKLKKSAGKIVLKINEEILELQSEYNKSNDGITKKAEALDKSVKTKKEALKDALKELENRPDYVKEQNMEKTIQMIKIILKQWLRCLAA